MDLISDPTRREPEAGEVVHHPRGDELWTGIVGLFEAPTAATEAFEVLLQLGYHPDEVGILIAESTKDRFREASLLTHPEEPVERSTVLEEAGPSVFRTEHEGHAGPELRAVWKGAGVVGALGALSGLLVAGAANVLAPGLGLVLVGPITGMAAGFGALVGGVYGVPAMENRHARELTRYESEVRSGKVLIQVTPHSIEDEERIRAAWSLLQPATA
ncbi:MAG: hypothetical protein IPK67_14630 [Planctomycetes bacterium]|nr:hypothetical protein [Planctomycetota bacterium]